MCNRYGYLAPVSRLADEFSQIRIPLVFKGGAIPNIAPREHIRPTDTAPIIRPIDREDPAAGVELIDARWWLIPFFHRKSVKEWKPMCTNARAETLATAATFREAFKRRRCLVPATHFFEWTGPKGAKQMWRFTKADAEVFCFPGLWDVAETTDGRIESFTIVTTAPGPDCAPYHSRQPVILEPEHWGTWLDLSADPAPILEAGLEGVIAVERAIESQPRMLKGEHGRVPSGPAPFAALTAPQSRAVNLARGRGRGLGQLLFHDACVWNYTSALCALFDV